MPKKIITKEEFELLSELMEPVEILNLYDIESDEIQHQRPYNQSNSKLKDSTETPKSANYSNSRTYNIDNLKIQGTHFEKYIKNNPYRILGLYIDSNIKKETDKLIKQVNNDLPIDNIILFGSFFGDSPLNEDIVRENKTKIDKDTKQLYKKYWVNNGASPICFAIEDLCKLIETKSNSENDWNNLHERFQKTHPSYLEIFYQLAFLLWWENSLDFNFDFPIEFLKPLANQKYDEYKSKINQILIQLDKKYEYSIKGLEFTDLDLPLDGVLELQSSIILLKKLEDLDIDTSFLINQICRFWRNIVIEIYNNSSTDSDKLIDYCTQITNIALKYCSDNELIQKIKNDQKDIQIQNIKLKVINCSKKFSHNPTEHCQELLSLLLKFEEVAPEDCYNMHGGKSKFKDIIKMLK
jgi:hypothetical protein